MQTLFDLQIKLTSGRKLRQKLWNVKLNNKVVNSPHSSYIFSPALSPADDFGLTASIHRIFSVLLKD